MRNLRVIPSEDAIVLNKAPVLIETVFGPAGSDIISGTSYSTGLETTVFINNEAKPFKITYSYNKFGPLYTQTSTAGETITISLIIDLNDCGSLMAGLFNTRYYTTRLYIYSITPLDGTTYDATTAVVRFRGYKPGDSADLVYLYSINQTDKMLFGDKEIIFNIRDALGPNMDGSSSKNCHIYNPRNKWIINGYSRAGSRTDPVVVVDAVDETTILDYLCGNDIIISDGAINTSQYVSNTPIAWSALLNSVSLGAINETVWATSKMTNGAAINGQTLSWTKPLKQLYLLNGTIYDPFDNVTMTLSTTNKQITLSGGSSGTGSDHSTDTFSASFLLLYTDGTQDRLNLTMPVDHYYDAPCLVAGTIVKTQAGDKKIEDIIYSDLLLTYDVFRGKLCYQHPAFIKKEHNTEQYLLITLTDNTEIKIVREHNFYDIKNKVFLDITDYNYDKLDLDNILFMHINEDGSLGTIGIKSIKPIADHVTFYTLFTSGTMCYFAGNVLNGSPYFNFLGGMKDNDTLNTNLMEIADTTMGQLPYQSFKENFGALYEPLYKSCLLNYIGIGLLSNLHEQTKEAISAHTTNDPVIRFREIVNTFWADLQTYDNDLCYLTFRYKNGTESKIQAKFKDTILIPFGTFYNVGDRKIYHKDDAYMVEMNTVFEEI